MRNFIFQLIIIASALFAGVSCSKEKVTLYTEAPGIYFNGFSTTYNFTEHPENVEIGCDTVNIPFLITGSAMDKERVIKVRLSPEDTITAEESMYELLSGECPRRKLSGAVAGENKLQSVAGRFRLCDQTAGGGHGRFSCHGFEREGFQPVYHQ